MIKKPILFLLIELDRERLILKKALRKEIQHEDFFDKDETELTLIIDDASIELLADK